jgi:hypothetical protein
MESDPCLETFMSFTSLRYLTPDLHGEGAGPAGKEDESG